MKQIFKNISGEVLIIALFVIIPLLYFSPMLEGKRFIPGDTQKFKGMSKELRDFQEKTGEKTLWTNSMFGGMPTYLISSPQPPKVISFINRILTLFSFRPVSFVFLYLLGFYIALRLFGVNRWLSFTGAFAYGFSTYFFVIIFAGHATKSIALGYLPVIVAGVYYALKKKPLAGCIITGFALALQLINNHLQITYYTLIIVMIMGVFLMIDSIKEKQFNKFIGRVGLLFIPVILAVGVSFAGIITTIEYGEYSIRGASELNYEQNDNKTSGLDKDYILNDYSYGIAETFDLFIPNFVGGSHSNYFGTKSEIYKKLKSLNAPNSRQIVNQLPTYWGPQRYTAGPVYIGAVVIFLFFFGAFLVKGKVKWWLVSITILSILLALGKHFYFFSNFFIEYVPGYNKFRTVSMTLVIAEFAMPLLGIIGLNEFFNGKHKKESFLNAIKWSVIITGGLALIFVLFPGLFFNFKAPIDDNLLQSGWPQELIQALRTDRQQLLKTDAFRSLIFVILTAGSLLAYFYKKLSVKVLYFILPALILLDLWTVDKRYLNNDHFSRKQKAEIPYIATKADNEILEDPDPDYKVLDLTVSTFNDARTSYFHKSIGGYHGAKMRRYQELISLYISPEMSSIINALQGKNPGLDINTAMQNMSILNMLNCKYIILNGNSSPLKNPYALGACWFVDKYRIVEDADAEISAIGNFNPANEAIIDNRFEDQFQNITINSDSTAKIHLLEYQPNKLIYESESTYDQMVVFSEIYYPKGWKVTIDGKPADFFRANYVLRGMILPSGHHKIEFKFEPDSYNLGRRIALISTVILFILAGAFLFRQVRYSSLVSKMKK